MYYQLISWQSGPLSCNCSTLSGISIFWTSSLFDCSCFTANPTTDQLPPACVPLIGPHNNQPYEVNYFSKNLLAVVLRNSADKIIGNQPPVSRFQAVDSMRLGTKSILAVNEFLYDIMVNVESE